MKYKDDDETDREIREKLNHITMHEKDVERHTLDHKHHKDLKHIRLDEGY